MSEENVSANGAGQEAEPEQEQEQEPSADRLAQPVDAEQPPRLPFPVVGIGASAGGLEAVGELLDAMPSDGGMAFVLVQHLPPDHESHLAEILSRRTAMPVQQVEDGMAVECDHVYVIRPGHLLTIRDGRLHIGAKLGTPKAANRPIDDFFRSLAEEQRERAVCVVLSGMGSNGTAGAQAIKAVGGLGIAQDPESAAFASMPRHLIDSGYADYVLRPSDIPGVLLRYAGDPYSRGGREADAESILRKERHHLGEILAILRTRKRQDFAGYKKPTLIRRIQRRMGLTRLSTMAEYARMLRQSPSEVTALGDDLLIHVTGFFRNPDAWEALRQLVVKPLIDSREPGGPVRAWVTACSSGEEAYSLAMLLVEEAERAGRLLDIKVFATDMADRALAHARAGIYPGGIESEIPPARLGRFFTREDEVYRVKTDLRDRVVFAPQNILQDPPFSRIDIASCRNLLIYLEPAMQRRLLERLHFGLREGGALFLGTSETIAGPDDLFEVLDKKARIFRRVGPTRHEDVDFHDSHASSGSETAGASVGGSMRFPSRLREASRPSVAQLTQRALLERHTPPAIVVDRDHQIRYYHGDTRPFLQQLSGEPTRDVMLLAREGVRGAVRAALSRARAGDQSITIPEGWIDSDRGRRVGVAVTASPVVAQHPAEERDRHLDLFLVCFQARPEPEAPERVDPGVRIEEPTVELRRLRAELQATIEELQTSNEELRASNEEVMSVNEELQSANEELETSKEEMQSLNEELATVNSQLRAKVEEHQAASSDLTSLLASTDIAVLFLDTGSRIRRFTPAVRDLMDVIASDVGRPLTDLARRFDDPHLDDDALAVLDRLSPAEREVAGSNGRHYLRRITPYRTTDNRIDGVVITFVDITARRLAEAALRESEARLRIALAASQMGTWTWDVAADVHIRDANLNRLLGMEPAETSRPLGEFLGRIHPDDRTAATAAFAESARQGRPLVIEFRVLEPPGAVRWLRNQGDVVGGPTGPGTRMAGVCVDITDLKEAEAALRDGEERLRLIVSSAGDYAILTLSPDRTVTSWSPGAVAAFGYREEEMLGRSADAIFTPEDRAAGVPLREAAEALGKGRSADERWHVRKDESRFYASGVLTPLGEGGVLGFVKVLRDLTGRKRMEDELRAARDQLEARVAERTAELTLANEARMALVRRLVTAQEDERRRVSRELHDGLGQELTALILGLKTLERAMSEDAPGRNYLLEVEETVKRLGREAHDLAVELRPTALDDIGLVPTLDAYVARWSERTGIAAAFEPLGLDKQRPSPEIETAVYRIVQEALNNVFKHAEARRVSVIIERRGGELTALIEDDGRGFDADRVDSTERRRGLGLLGMRERVNLLGGTLVVESGDGGGTIVRARIPMPPAAEEESHGD
ncbi:chemotaxis protein CheB [Singulisphaera sp. PoT]|uniref:chemotaxis protein CheB n=1 Tax=Singulisphaera sp. PoT TaxID=3411797 RepID=UPI003BF523D9